MDSVIAIGAKSSKVATNLTWSSITMPKPPSRCSWGAAMIPFHICLIYSSSQPTRVKIITVILSGAPEICMHLLVIIYYQQLGNTSKQQVTTSIGGKKMQFADSLFGLTNWIFPYIPFVSPKQIG